MSHLVSQAEFARLMGRDKALVTRWKQAGRLVMVNGLVDVEASRQRVQASESPLPHHQAAHEAAGNGQKRPVGAFSDGGMGEGLGTLEKIGLKLKFEQARKTQAEAEKAMMERDTMAGRLLDADEARRHVSGLGLTLRSTLESIPDRLAGPLSAETSPERVHAMLVEEIEQALNYAAEQIGKMGAAA